MKELLYEQYGIRPSELSMLGPYQSFWVRNKVYILIPIGKRKEEELIEMKQLSDFMTEQGDVSVATFVPTVQGYYVSEMKEVNYCLLRAVRQTERSMNEGRELGMFHLRGRLYPGEISELSRIGEWRELWEKRLDQLEKFWYGRLTNHPTTSFEKLFIDSFPYYLGLAENAIQYVVDTELDAEPQVADAATICQQRFTDRLWHQTNRVKVPIDWVFDHPSRDLAEWVRHMYEEGEHAEEKIMTFLGEYEAVAPLSAFGWRLLFARLLFPLQYFETIEGYYLSGGGDQPFYQDRIGRILERTNESERFLANFYQSIRLPTETLGIPKLDWFT
ncbi:spore coat protein YutH [Ectobacillus sp. JY-23]|uniref:spore coat putative kinase YutH n=1 Tax=Ectobacillus sp. JY-23 TaxID=2933872 RepID=UPI001FF15715|nr:spore coat protein YutH [Ectobacillus sp. JY-23]UOY90980.1 spore coat protein YutH [Ectobacillus sp. JY-23]